MGYRPADEDRARGCDTSILTNMSVHIPNLRIVDGAVDARQIVDFKSPDEQVTPYRALDRHQLTATWDPWEALKDVFPAEALDEMAALYASRRELVAA
jgi:hypothetical protein